jgi:GNAT superfamily N-acetyltransferase
MQIMPSSISSLEVIRLFTEYDDFIVDFLGEDSVYYTRYSGNESLQAVWIACCDGLPVGCVTYRAKSPGVGEVKRMFVKASHRGRGISKSLLTTVEQYAKERGDAKLYLDTRITLEPAVSLYRGFGFMELSRKGLYVEMEKQLHE